MKISNLFRIFFTADKIELFEHKKKAKRERIFHQIENFLKY